MSYYFSLITAPAAMDDIAGMSHADKLGQLVYYFKYSSQERCWFLDPKQAQVLI